MEYRRVGTGYPRKGGLSATTGFRAVDSGPECRNMEALTRRITLSLQKEQQEARANRTSKLGSGVEDLSQISYGHSRLNSTQNVSQMNSLMYTSKANRTSPLLSTMSTVGEKHRLAKTTFVSTYAVPVERVRSQSAHSPPRRRLDRPAVRSADPDEPLSPVNIKRIQRALVPPRPKSCVATRRAPLSNMSNTSLNVSRTLRSKLALSKTLNGEEHSRVGHRSFSPPPIPRSVPTEYSHLDTSAMVREIRWQPMEPESPVQRTRDSPVSHFSRSLRELSSSALSSPRVCDFDEDALVRRREGVRMRMARQDREPVEYEDHAVLTPRTRIEAQHDNKEQAVSEHAVPDSSFLDSMEIPKSSISNWDDLIQAERHEFYQWVDKAHHLDYLRERNGKPALSLLDRLPAQRKLAERITNPTSVSRISSPSLPSVVSTPPLQQSQPEMFSIFSPVGKRRVGNEQDEGLGGTSQLEESVVIQPSVDYEDSSIHEESLVEEVLVEFEDSVIGLSSVRRAKVAPPSPPEPSPPAIENLLVTARIQPSSTREGPEGPNLSFSRFDTTDLSPVAQEEQVRLSEDFSIGMSAVRLFEDSSACNSVVKPCEDFAASARLPDDFTSRSCEDFTVIDSVVRGSDDLAAGDPATRLSDEDFSASARLSDNSSQACNPAILALSEDSPACKSAVAIFPDIDILTDQLLGELVDSVLADVCVVPRSPASTTASTPPVARSVKYPSRTDAFDSAYSPPHASRMVDFEGVARIVREEFLGVVCESEETELDSVQIASIKSYPLHVSFSTTLSLSSSLSMCIADSFFMLLDSLSPAEAADREWAVKFGVARNPLSAFLPQRHTLGTVLVELSKLLAEHNRPKDDSQTRVEAICSEFVKKFRLDHSLFQHNVRLVDERQAREEVIEEVNAFILDAVIASVANDFGFVN